MEDTTSALAKKSDHLNGVFAKYLLQRERYQSEIEDFDDDVAVLHRIPVFNSLLEMEATESMVGSLILDPDRRPQPRDERMTLLQWINSRGSSTSLESLADGCYRTLEKLDEELFQGVSADVDKVVQNSKSQQMKEIGGLSERLQGLEQILMEARQRSQEQHDLAKAFVHNQQRASGLRDASILPDLCASHKEQLKVMSSNYKKITSIRKRCAKAKEELSANLHHRMKWVCYVQDQMAEKVQLLMMYLEELRRLEKKMDVIEQLHIAPSIYIATAVEVVRRKAFSDHYLKRANALSDKFSALHDEEVSIRTNFQVHTHI